MRKNYDICAYSMLLIKYNNFLAIRQWSILKEYTQPCRNSILMFINELTITKYSRKQYHFSVVI